MNQFLLGSSPRLTALVWGLAGAIFSLFAIRLVATSAFMHGLPHHGTWIPFWLFIAFFFVLPIARPSQGIWFYLCSLPVLSSLDLLQLGPCWKVHEVALAAFFLGWCVWFLFRGRKVGIQTKWIDFAIGCLALSFAFGSLYGLAHPSWVNSISVAFSWAHWPEKTEFNAISMGYAYMAGIFVYAALRFALEGRRDEAPRILLGILWIQLTLSVLLAFGYAGVRAYLDGGLSLARDFLLLPFGKIHFLAGPAVLFAGFFIGALIGIAKNSMKGRLWYWLAAFAGVLLAIVSISKAAWLGLMVLASVAFSACLGWRAFFYAILGCIGLLLAARILLPDEIGREGAHGFIKEQLVILTNPSRLINHPSVVERTGIWGNAMKMVLAHPLAGVGVGQFSSLMEHYSFNGFIGSKNWQAYSNPVSGDLDIGFQQDSFNGYHAHNDFLEITSGLGLLTGFLFLFLIGLLIISGWQIAILKDISHYAQILGYGSTFALFGFAFIALIDSRFTSFNDSVLFWQIAAGVVLGLRTRDQPHIVNRPPSSWKLQVPILAPIAVVAGAIFTLHNEWLPKDRSFGIWNWHLQEERDVFLLAKEAQFIIPPEENIKALHFRIPRDTNSDSLGLTLKVHDSIIINQKIEKDASLEVSLQPFRKSDECLIVTLKAEKWAGKGALGSQIGLKPYAIKMTKIRNPSEDSSDFSSVKLQD